MQSRKNIHKPVMSMELRNPKHKVEISGINTSNIKVLTNEEMNELFIRLKNGDEREDLL